jgi:hypothetical protein
VTVAKEVARWPTPGGGTVTLHRGGLLAVLTGDGAWYECTACPDRMTVRQWSSKAQADLTDYDGTERAAQQHAATCHRI